MAFARYTEAAAPASCQGNSPETLVYTKTDRLFQMPFLFPTENTIYLLYL
jgi:hypothetical protein